MSAGQHPQLQWLQQTGIIKYHTSRLVHYRHMYTEHKRNSCDIQENKTCS